MKRKPTFFERLTGSVRIDDDFEQEPEHPHHQQFPHHPHQTPSYDSFVQEEELTIDIIQKPEEIVIRALVPGVNPDDIEINVTRDVVTIRGERSSEHESHDTDFFHRELHWGAFSRTIPLPDEVRPDDAYATEKHGVLHIHLPRFDKEKQTRIKVKSM